MPVYLTPMSISATNVHKLYIIINSCVSIKSFLFHCKVDRLLSAQYCSILGLSRKVEATIACPDALVAKTSNVAWYVFEGSFKVFRYGGDNGSRTHDLLHAMQAF